jgi:hypothetical protein
MALLPWPSNRFTDIIAPPLGGVFYCIKKGADCPPILLETYQAVGFIKLFDIFQKVTISEGGEPIKRFSEPFDLT